MLVVLAGVAVAFGLVGDGAAPFLVATVASLGAVLFLGLAVARSARGIKRGGS